MTDPIADMLTRIRNAITASKETVEIPASNEKKSVISVLQRASKPGLRSYAGVADMPKVLGGLGTVILSTNKGIMTGKNAKAANVGGEVLCEIW